MKKVLDWVKANVVALVCALLVLVAIGWVFMINGWGAEFTKRLQTRLDRVKALSAFQSQVISFPSPKTEGGTETKPVTINRAVIAQLKEIYTKMEREGKGIFDTAIRTNRVQQIPMTTNLFPDNKDTSLRIIARGDYRKSFNEMFEPYSSSAGLPRLRARSPIAESEMDIALKSARDAYVVSLGGKTEAELTAMEREKLAEELQKKRVEVFQQYAKSLNIYAQSDSRSGEYPFQIMSWSARGTPPNDLELWEGQMQLWIQQDMARVIALTNSVAQQDMDVTRSPIKRLMKMEVKPGYIGLGGRAMPSESGGASSSGSGELRLNPAEEDFGASCTGRKSNELYDVRHARLEMIVDIVRLPEFFDNMVQVNFLTVLNMEVTDIDEYEDLKRNYYYGLGDCVKVTIDIESIWLRDWTSKLMPAQVKADLGVPIEAPK